MSLSYSHFARSLEAETAFTVLAVAKRLKAAGKDVVELEIGDSPFETPAHAKAAGVKAIEDNQTHYCPSAGLPEFREAIARFMNDEFGVAVTGENVVVGHGAKVFELFFCETFLDPGDGVLVFSPHFPTYEPNILRRGARAVLARLRIERDFRPDPADVERFLATDPKPKAIFLNFPHNPTGGVATEEDLRQIGDLVRGRNVAIFSDEPYCHMVWGGPHATPLSQPGLLEQTVAAYTFSKSYSMSGWRVGYSISSRETAERIATMINTSLSCVPPLAQLAGRAALELDRGERDRQMRLFQNKVHLLTAGLNKIAGVRCLEPKATFYAFPSVAEVCNRLEITSHGLAMFLLEAADDRLGVACLGGECFGRAGAGFIRFSCAEPDDRIRQAVGFLGDAFGRVDRARAYLAAHPQYRLAGRYV